MATLYMKPDNGISGDMVAGLLFALGASEETITSVMESLSFHNHGIAVKKVEKRHGENVVMATDYTSLVHEENSEEHEHPYDNDHPYNHEHSHNHRHSHEHEHRTLQEVRDIIRQADMTETARERAYKIYDIIGAAEGKAHGLPVDEVHFHEVGEKDSIMDILAVAAALDDLGIDVIRYTSPGEGSGTVMCRHGELPIPVPAVQNILDAYRIEIHSNGLMGEFITPTGAAILAAFGTEVEETELLEQFGAGKSHESGADMSYFYGSGKREYDGLSVLGGFIR